MAESNAHEPKSEIEPLDLSELEYVGIPIDVLSTDKRPVNVHLAHETMMSVRTEITEFQDVYFDDLPMGPQTKANFLANLNHLREHPEGVNVFAHGEMLVGDDEEPPARLTVGQSALSEVFPAWTKSAFEHAGINADSDKVQKFANRWSVWHELGHIFQLSSARAVNPEHGKILDLSGYALDLGVVDPPEPLPKGNKWIEQADCERFAEGFAHMLLIQAMKLDPEFTPKEVERFSSTIARQRESERLWGEELINTELKINPSGEGIRQVDALKLGYGTPHDARTVLAVMSLTEKLENQASEEQLNFGVGRL